MDSKIRSYPAKDFGDGHDFCYYHGIVYQRDLNHPVEYAEDYFENYQKYEHSPIADALNDFRVGLANRYIHPRYALLDVGVGCGTFLKRFEGRRFGYDINPIGVAWLQEEGLYYDPYQEEKIPDWFLGVSLWDVLEHMPNPDLLLNRLQPGMYVLTSLPIFMDIHRVRESKHFKPNEHYYYFQYSGLVSYFNDMGFEKVWSGDDETRIGREQIMSFVFRRK